MAKAGKQTVDVAAEPLTLFCNDRDKNKQYNYPTNYIRTTKYTALTFLPLNMMEQFRKMSNVFFLLNMVIALIPGVSPVFPATTILPLVVVVGVAALRDAFEDFHRYQADRRANALPVKRVDVSGKVVSIQSHETQVGDIILLERGSEIPVDCVVISTALSDGACFVETANLDGETNLKPKQTKGVYHKVFNSPQAVAQLSGTIVCDAPNNSLHSWQGKMSIPSIADQSIDMDNFLLRGCTIRNVDWVLAATVYTGVNTKLFLNLTQKPPKVSRLDTKLNRLILMILAVQQIIMLVMCSLHVVWRNDAGGNAFYVLPLEDDHSDGLAWILAYLTYFILLSLMMPISLFVSLEFCKAAQAKLMEWDHQLTNKNDWMRARTSSLNEELSQVQYIFSDKTGTLTDNEMRFARAFAGETAFDEIKASGSLKKHLSPGSGASEASKRDVSNFLRLLSLCSTVVINTHPDGSITYDGSSTDEVALVSTALINGARLLARTSDSLTVDIQQDLRTIELITVLPFTAERKMMSVVLREKDGTIRMYTKGADSSVLARLDKRGKNPPRTIAQAQGFLDECARIGLRTLACGERIFEPHEFAQWKAMWDRACLDTSAQRSDLVHTAALEGESNLVFVGCTAIEDRLQDEVPETIHFLLKCGIVVWVLTGDKRETALNIAATSKLLNPHEDLVVQIDLEAAAGRQSAVEVIQEATRQVKEARAKGQKASFIVDGKSLEVILQESTFEPFRQLGLLVNSAVCCRVTPLQKASVVAMFQELGSTCLGVGDGANDVSMIQEARVGIGILGLEGSQAERAADYAIPRFRHLRRLLSVHGRYSLIRNSQLVQYSFYKNVVYSLTQVYFSFYNGFTGMPIYDSWVIILFNMAFTFLPPMVMGIFDFDVRDAYLLKHPKLYGELRSPFAVRMSRASSLLWMTLSIYHSWVIYYGTLRGSLEDDLVNDGRAAGVSGGGTIMMTVLLSVVICQAAVSFLSWTWLHFLSIVVSFAAYTAFLYLYAALPPTLDLAAYYHVPQEIYAHPSMWLNTILWTLALFAPHVAVLVIRRSFFSIDMHLARAGDHQVRKSLPWETVVVAASPSTSATPSRPTAAMNPGDERSGGAGKLEEHARPFLADI